VPPATGGVEQKTRLAFDEGRELECALSFNNPWPTLHVTYLDPSFKAEDVVAIEDHELQPEEPISSVPALDQSELKTRGSRLPAFVKRKIGRVLDTGIWLRPTTVTALFALILIGSLAVWYLRRPNPSPV